MKRTSSLDVARRAQVSQATVSLVLNDRHHIAIPETTRQRVRNAALELGYHPNRLARSLLSGRTQTLGILLPSLASSFVASLVEGIQAAAGDHAHQVLLAHTRHDPDFELQQLQLLLEHKVDGILIITGEATLGHLPARLDMLAQQKLPTVVLDDAASAERVDCVVSDDCVGARLAVDHLIQLGHRRIAHLAAGQQTSSARDRLAGYAAALQFAGIPFDPGLVAGDSYLGGSGTDSLARLLQARRPPTAVFAANDRRLAEALPLLRTRGIQVPNDLALVGYANYDFSAYLDFTSVDQNPREMGRQAALRLLARIAEPTMKPQLLQHPTTLIRRGSSQR